MMFSTALVLCLASQGNADPTALLRPLVGVPYVVDAGEDEQGHCVLFSSGKALAQPGLNCSGFVVAASRRLLGFKGSLQEAGRDRRGDSGAKARQGQDWDYGLDLILNLSEGRTRRILLPEGPRAVPDEDGRTLRGFALGTPRLWDSVLPQLRREAVYLVSLSRVKGGRLAHHHVAMILKDSQDGAWFYHTLPHGRVHRVALHTAAGQARMRQMFGSAQRLLVLEVERPL